MIPVCLGKIQQAAHTIELSPLGSESNVLKVVRVELQLGSKQEFRESEQMTFSICFLLKCPV